MACAVNIILFDDFVDGNEQNKGSLSSLQSRLYHEKLNCATVIHKSQNNEVEERGEGRGVPIRRGSR